MFSHILSPYCPPELGTTSGIVTGISGGTVTISYVVATGCFATRVITVNTVPPITGVHNLCAWGDTVTIHDANPAGAFSSTLVTVLNLGGGAGKVTSNAAGTGTVIYTLTSGCSTSVTVTVNPLPGPITGICNLCVSATTILHDTASGGTWSSSGPGITTSGSLTGIVTGVAAGTSYIIYTLPTGCKLDTAVHVNPAPAAIIGWSSYVTIGTTTTFTDAIPGGIWTSSNPARATVGISSGVVTGVSAGTTILSYTVGTGCSATRSITVSALGATNPGDGGTISIVPNPNKGSFSISGTLGVPLFSSPANEEEMSIEVTDMEGQVVYRNWVICAGGAINEKIQLNNIANGTYSLKLHSASENRVFHLVVER